MEQGSSKILEDREVIVNILTTIIEDLLDEEGNEDAIFDDLLELQMRLAKYRLELLEERDKEGGT